jgi:hypothetical protein
VSAYRKKNSSVTCHFGEMADVKHGRKADLYNNQEAKAVIKYANLLGGQTSNKVVTNGEGQTTRL